MLVVPKLQMSPRRWLGRLRRRVRETIRGETAETYFDLHNPRELQPVLDAHGVTLGDWQMASSIRVRRIFEWRDDVRLEFPLGFTPQGRRELLLWLLSCGAKEYGVSAEESLKYLHELDETPDRGLVTHYLMRADWQRDVPDALMPDGWLKLIRFLAKEFGLAGRWSRRTTLPKSAIVEPIPVSGGANVVAHFRYASGLQEAAFGVVNGLNAVNVPMAKRDLPVIYPCDWNDSERYLDLERFDTTIYVSAVNTFPHEWYPKAALHPRPGVRRIAVWFWELDEVPAAWHPRLQWADEVWAPTNFTAEAFRKCVECPVLTMLPGIELSPFAPKPRSAFGLPDDRFLFLFSFDMRSIMVRKNPLASIEAFRKAFRPDEKVHLAIKVSRGECIPEDFATLKAAASAANVQLIDGVLPRADVLALLNAADCYVSPHRSEGLGLGIAESMLLGKPTIATGYSGNLDFMTPETNHFIEYTLVPVEADQSNHNPYPAARTRWAEPNVDHLSKLMRHVYENQREAKEMGLRAKAHIERIMSPRAFGMRMKERLAELSRSTRTRLPNMSLWLHPTVT